MTFMMVARLIALTSTTELAWPDFSRAGKMALTASPDLEPLERLESVILMETLDRDWAVFPAATLTLYLMSSMTLNTSVQSVASKTR